MRTLRSAASLLASATSSDTLAPIAAAILGGNCPLSAERIAPETADRLGLPRTTHNPLVLRGAGTLRALVVESSDSGTLREVVTRIASRLAQRSPHLLWLLLVVERHGTGVAIAAWSQDRSPPRVNALLADRARVVDSDAETLCSLAAARGGVDVLVHLRWLDLLGRDALTRRFYRTLERTVSVLAAGAEGHANPEERASLALLNVSRLLFLAFLEAKGWLDGDRGFLARRFDECIASGGGFDRRVLRPLFFGTLNTPPRSRAPVARALGRIPFLNGGLFSRTPLERRLRHLRFRDEDLGALFGEVLSRYRFTAREDSTSWSEAAIDPEMLGKAFESLMGSRDRRDSGAFYTPQALVTHVTHAGLCEALAGGSVDRSVVSDALARAGVSRSVRSEALTGAGADRSVLGEAFAGAVDPRYGEALRERIGRFRVLDPACGSGAFLVLALEQLTNLVLHCGDTRPVAEVRREVLTRSIFGVDINPTAVWLCELRLWLSVVIDSEHPDPLTVPPLPNLDHHVRVGDALMGDAFATLPTGPLFADGAPAAGALASPCRVARRIERLRGRYTRATGRRKDTLARALDREERNAALEALETRIARAAHARRDLLAMIRSRDLFGARTVASTAERATLDGLRRQARSLRARRAALRAGASLPFTFAAHFADAAASGGFDLVVGNPPWVRLHHIPPPMRLALRQRYRVFQQAAWESGAAGARAGAGFAGQVDLSALFVERSLALLGPRGTLALLVPAKLWRSLAGGGVRRILLEDARVLALEDWSDAPTAFDAAVYPSLIVAGAGFPQPEGQRADRPIRAAIQHRGRPIEWSLRERALPLDATPGSPWLLVPSEVRAGFDRLTTAGIPMGSSTAGRPLLGVKSGCNEAFIVEVTGVSGDVACVRAGERRGQIEASMLRPLLRGEDISAWRADPADRFIIWTHAPDGAPLASLPPLTERWLRPWRRRLTARSDSRPGARWWSLYRTGAAATDVHRVVWADFGRSPRAAVLPAGSPAVPLNSCYIVRCVEPDDALALAAILNGPLAAAWLSLIAEPARGGYHRFLGWTMARLPLPADWPRARDILAPAGRRGGEESAPSDHELLDAAIRAYRLRTPDVAPLLAWATR